MEIDKEKVELELPVITFETDIKVFRAFYDTNAFILQWNNCGASKEIVLEKERADYLLTMIENEQKRKALDKLFNGLTKEDIREFLGLDDKSPIKAFVVASDETSAQQRGLEYCTEKDIAAAIERIRINKESLFCKITDKIKDDIETRIIEYTADLYDRKLSKKYIQSYCGIDADAIIEFLERLDYKFLDDELTEDEILKMNNSK